HRLALFVLSSLPYPFPTSICLLPTAFCLLRPLPADAHVTPLVDGRRAGVALALDLLEAVLELAERALRRRQPGRRDLALVNVIAQLTVLVVEKVVRGRLIGQHGVGRRAQDHDVVVLLRHAGPRGRQLVLAGVRHRQDPRGVDGQTAVVELEDDLWQVGRRIRGRRSCADARISQGIDVRRARVVQDLADVAERAAGFAAVDLAADGAGWAQRDGQAARAGGQGEWGGQGAGQRLAAALA